MKINIFITLTIILVIYLSACNKTEEIIIEGVETITFKNCFEITQNEYVINTDTAYYNFLSNTINTPECLNYTPPALDFSKKTLIGKHISATGCAISYQNTIKALPQKKQYLVSINANIDENCNKDLNEIYWLSTPKLPANYTVIFEVNKQ